MMSAQKISNLSQLKEFLTENLKIFEKENTIISEIWISSELNSDLINKGEELFTEFENIPVKVKEGQADKVLFYP